ncbi:TSUP family transporter [Bacteriovoracaceae bacterium]|nr:TSUP family transporter [Bacteriovoracaceae bacterium]
MIVSVESQILIGVLVTSIVSGVLGMGGGMMLMALYATLLPVKMAMVLHGITQVSANGFRAYIHKDHITYKILLPYFIGVGIVFIALRIINFVPDKGLLYLTLGIFPFITFLPKVSEFFSISRKNRPLLCGGAVTFAQITAGASGGILDIFFINSPLTRYEIIATKAFTQTFGHIVKLIYYLTLINFATELNGLNFWIIPGVIGTSFLGTYIGKKILIKLNDKIFRQISKVIILLIAIGLIYKGIFFFL